MAIHYQPDGKVLTDFLFSNGPADFTQGPVGSGSSSACVMRMFRHAVSQEPNGEGIRRTKWLIVRPTYPQLRDTVLVTYEAWIKPGKGSPETIMTPPYRHHIHPDCEMARMSDGTRLDMEVIFLAVDPQTTNFGFLDSYEMTGIFINEVQDYMNFEVISALDGRASQGRFPPPMDGVVATWCGIFGDLNAPPEGHWLPYMRGDVTMPEHWTLEKRKEFEKPKEWGFFVQPPGLIEKFDHAGRMIGYEDNPAAENRRWRRVPYSRLIVGKTKSWIDTKVMNRVGMIREGDPVFPMFSLERHVSEGIYPVPGIALTVGIDLARNPFAVIGQNVRGSWRIYSEIGARGVSASQFGPLLKRHLFERFPEFVSEGADGMVSGVNFWGDPSGTRRGDGTDDSSYSILQGMGIMIQAAPGNNAWEVRRTAVENCLMRVTPDGDPGMVVHKTACPTVKNGMFTGYILGDDNRPKKNQYADACDAVQYMVLGGGEGTAVINAGKSDRPKVVSYATERKRRLKRVGN